MGLSLSSIIVLVFGVIMLYGGMLYFILIIDNIYLIDYLPFSQDRLENLLNASMKIKGILTISLVIIIIIPLLAASVDVGLIEKGNGGSKKFSITFTENQFLLDPVNGYTDEGDTTEGSIAINQTNITKILFVLSWDESGQEAIQDDEFRLGILPPEYVNSNLSESNFTPSNSEQSSSGEVSIEVQLNTTENESKIWADSTDDVVEMFTSEFGTGEWGYEVEAVDCPPDGPIVDLDTGNDWTLDITIYYFEGQIKEIKGTPFLV